MVPALSVHVVLSWATVFVAGVLAVVGWIHRSRPGTVPFAAMMGGVTLYNATVGTGLLVSDVALRTLLVKLQWVGLAPLGVLFFVFAAEYTGRTEFLTRRRIAGLFVVPAVTLLVVWTSQWHSLFWTAPIGVEGAKDLFGTTIAVTTESEGAVYFLYLGYTYLLTMAGVVFLLETAFSSDKLYRGQNLALVVGAVAPVVLSAVSSVMPGLSPFHPGVDLAGYGFTLSGVGFGYAMFRFRLLEQTPAAKRHSRDAVVRNLDDGVLVFDGDEVIVDANDAASRMIDQSRADLLGLKLGELFETLPFEEPDHIDALDGEVFRAPKGRWYEVNVTPLLDDDGVDHGWVVEITDVTDRHSREQRLSVLNRVLRHNFRNDMNLIAGYTDQLQQYLSEPEGEEIADIIDDIATELLHISETAREIEKVMSHEPDDTEVDLTRLVARVLTDTFDEDTAVDVRMNVSGNLQIHSSQIVEAILSELVENARVHNDSEEPRVEITAVEVTQPEPGVRITVEDNGPGLPSQEQKVFEKEAETPLQHGSGLGLWLVYWGASRINGEVSFGDNDPRGTVARVDIPAEPPTEETVSLGAEQEGVTELEDA